MRVSNFSNTTNWSELEAAVTLITVRTANTRCCLYRLDTKRGVKKKPQWNHKEKKCLILVDCNRNRKKNDHLQSQQTYQQSSKYPIIPGCSRSNTQSFHVFNVQQNVFLSPKHLEIKYHPNKNVSNQTNYIRRSQPQVHGLILDQIQTLTLTE